MSLTERAVGVDVWTVTARGVAPPTLDTAWILSS